MLTLKEYYQLTSEVSVSDFIDQPFCNMCDNPIYDTVVMVDDYDEEFCDYPCFEEWAIDQIATEMDRLYDERKDDII